MMNYVFKFLDFSMLTCMQIGEVCKLRWKDLNQEHKTKLIS
jgi:hypothetical protein